MAGVSMSRCLCWLHPNSSFVCELNELGGVNVGKKSSIDQNWVAWEVRVFLKVSGSKSNTNLKATPTFYPNK